MDLFNNKFEVVAKTFVGLENVLADEIRENGGEKIEIHNRAVSFETDLKGLYKFNLVLRTALHLLVPLAKANLNEGKELYDLAYNVEWEAIFKATKTFAVVSFVKSNLYNHTNYPALLVKDAIADRFNNKFDYRPSVSRFYPDVVVSVHVFGNEAKIFLDSSGISLHKRGYRIEKNIAPLNEVLAAGIILLSKWDKKTTFIDPMCGSGTFVIEAAMLANKIPPNLNSSKFSFKHWRNFDLKLFGKVKNLLKREITENNVRIIGNDISDTAIKIASSNAERAGVLNFIELNKTSFFEFIPPVGTKFLIFNPPYNKRIKLKNTISFYRKIGDTLKRNYNNSVAWIFSANKQALKKIGLSSSKKIVLDNGGTTSFLRRYEIYEGSKKAKSKSDIKISDE